MQVKTFTNLGIKTIAINKETPPDLRPQIMKVRVIEHNKIIRDI